MILRENPNSNLQWTVFQTILENWLLKKTWNHLSVEMRFIYLSQQSFLFPKWIDFVVPLRSYASLLLARSHWAVMVLLWCSILKMKRIRSQIPHPNESGFFRSCQMVCSVCQLDHKILRNLPSVVFICLHLSLSEGECFW